MNFVLDASVTLAWAFEDERDSRAERVLDRVSGSEAIVPSIWPLEIANALLVAERRRRIKPQDANRLTHLLLALPIVVDPVERRRPMEAVRRLARTHALSSYDASYLELALRLGIPIATLDTRLAAAAQSAGAEPFG